MTYSVTKVQTFRSPDGGGFNAVLLRDGKAVCHVHDGGHGGCYDFEWIDWQAPKVEIVGTNSLDKPFQYRGTPEEARFSAYVQSLPVEDGIRPDMDITVAELVDCADAIKRLTRGMKTKVFFTKEQGGTIFSVKATPGAAQRMEVKYPKGHVFTSAQAVYLYSKLMGE